jgi:hypothetical protein
VPLSDAVAARGDSGTPMLFGLDAARASPASDDADGTVGVAGEAVVGASWQAGDDDDDDDEDDERDVVGSAFMDLAKVRFLSSLILSSFTFSLSLTP